MGEAEDHDTGKAAVAALNAAARAAVAAVYAYCHQSNRRLSRRIGRTPSADDEPRAEQIQVVGEMFFDFFAEPPRQAEKPGGRFADRVAPMSALRALGWRILPVPLVAEEHELLSARMNWRKRQWVAIPPDASDLAARLFSGPGHAQRWATEMAGLSEVGK